MNRSIVNIRAVTTASVKVNRVCPNSTGFERERKYLYERMQKFARERNIFARECKSIAREHKDLKNNFSTHPELFPPLCL